MKWLKCELSVPIGQVEIVRGALLVEGFSGWEERERGAGLELVVHLPLVDEDEGVDRESHTFEKLIRDSLGRVLTSMGVADRDGVGFTYELVDDEDWAHSWKRFWKPMRIGRLFAVVPSWEAFEPEAGDRVITLDPGMAFGTGTHETTRMCIEWLERVMRSGDRVLDVGTGSGILSIAALLLGASCVIAVDNDPIATRTARENLERNGLDDGRAQVRDGSGLDVVSSEDGLFDVVVANVVADFLVSLAPRLPALLRRGGHFVGSGVIQERLDDVDTALEKAGFAERNWERQGEWASVSARIVD